MATDQIDFANELAQRERDYAVTVRKPVPLRTGKCKACGAALERPQAFYCDADCAQDGTRQERADALAGRVLR